MFVAGFESVCAGFRERRTHVAPHPQPHYRRALHRTNHDDGLFRYQKVPLRRLGPHPAPLHRLLLLHVQAELLPLLQRHLTRHRERGRERVPPHAQNYRSLHARVPHQRRGSRVRE